MCGIAGAFRVDGGSTPPLPEPVLRRMTELIEYRGPDDAGFVSDAGCSLGARRLSIIDVEGGHQPFANERGRIWGAQNGEIYNHDQLREELRGRGHVFTSRCDTEVLPHLYEDHGPAMAERLRGMFAVAVWDQDKRRGVLIRDRLGVKPLYYAHVGDVVVFGSELKCVVASGLVGSELDAEAISAYLMLGYVPSPMTPLKDVRKLAPGERLVIEDGAVRVERWWDYPAPEADQTPRSADEWTEIVRDALEDSVKMRLMSDVPLGAMLSGGLDSSLIVALMARHMNGQPLKTFAVGFEGADSELPDARRVADALGAEHHELQVSTATSTDALTKLAWHLDEPIADLSAVGFLALCELAVSEVTVALSGQGADELFGGYRKHRVASLVQHWTRLPGPARTAAAVAMRKGPGRSRQLLDALQSPDPVSRLLASSGLVRPELRASVFSGALAEQSGAAERVLRDRLAGAPGRGPLESAMYLDARLGLVDDMLAYFDRASMAKSLEVRVPFLDHEFVELAARVPAHLKVHRLQGKHVLREAAKGLVPDFVLAKKKRGFFNEAVEGWIGGGSGGAVDELLLGPDPAYAQVIDRDVVAGAVRDFRAGQGQHANFLLAVLMLELWLSKTLPRAFASAPEPLGVSA
ncbi:asparagine synthase (glutamine-hydrolyzing) [Solirubrobacter phytolaccae]|uniref:asparagine synthase (glutamine-hydrolyzing) n=1 Tax=Solirubrobacter phytolaccae TaxID=1404360 RepID=A0A9X3SAJ3_9ACTN|nr:asparagine synthase (glutamine-hydrolyzing) [Solirubrobacter phytolaccae]MDA0180320.1 asparagine synthase (glutamine-hydrolyzing) [Solirubrobacter phytolaccae]